MMTVKGEDAKYAMSELLSAGTTDTKANKLPHCNAIGSEDEEFSSEFSSSD